MSVPSSVGAGEPVGAGFRCRGCGARDVRRAVDLGELPASDDFPEVDRPGGDCRRPLELWFCRQCALAQLGPAEPPPADTVPAAESETSRRHARQAVAAVLAEHPWLVGREVREFASHHGGSWLDALRQRGCRPAPDDRPAALVVDVHALAHEPDLAGGLARRARSLASDGLLVLEHHHLLPLVRGGQFDTVRHGHWSYLSLTALQRLSAGHGLQVVRAVPEDVFGGSLRVTLSPVAARARVDGSVPQLLAEEDEAGLADGSGLPPLQAQARACADELREYLRAERAAGRRVIGYGAPSKAAVLLGLGGIGPDLLAFTADAAPLKHGRAVPGVRVPVRPVRELIAARPDVVLILTWDIADEVVGQLEAAGGWGAEYVVPLPRPHRLTSTGDRVATP